MTLHLSCRNPNDLMKRGLHLAQAVFPEKRLPSLEISSYEPSKFEGGSAPVGRPYLSLPRKAGSKCAMIAKRRFDRSRLGDVAGAGRRRCSILALQAYIRFVVRSEHNLAAKLDELSPDVVLLQSPERSPMCCCPPQSLAALVVAPHTGRWAGGRCGHNWVLLL